MKVLFINNAGGGFADRVVVADGMTVETFLREMLDDEELDLSTYKIRVNGDPVTTSQTLCDGDKCTCTPVKIAGA